MGKFAKLAATTAASAEGSAPVTTIGAPKRASATGPKGLLIRLPVSDWSTLKHIQAETGLSTQEQMEQALVYWFSQNDKGEPQAVRDRRAGKG